MRGRQVASKAKPSQVVKMASTLESRTRAGTIRTCLSCGARAGHTSMTQTSEAPWQKMSSAVAQYRVSARRGIFQPWRQPAVDNQQWAMPGRVERYADCRSNFGRARNHRSPALRFEIEPAVAQRFVSDVRVETRSRTGKLTKQASTGVYERPGACETAAECGSAEKL